MSSFAAWYQNGGSFMHLIVIVGLAVWPLAVTALAIRKRMLALISLSGGLAVIAIGGLGYLLGLQEVEQALAQAPSDQVESARVAGLAMARIPFEFSAMVALPALIVGLVGVVRSRHAS